ncbi:MAG: DNA polymerase I [Armatimonadota bacterium]|jgi:DNA polymerase-1
MNKNKPKLIAVDGNSLLYRAFFAMRYLSTSAGTPTNAVYGLTTMLLKVLEENPDYIVVAFDTPKPTFRHDQYDQYKAHRKAAPDALIEQAPIARELIQAFNIPTIEVEGYEGDDIIGALVTQARSHGVASEILTGDLDALQLVNEDVQVLTTVKGVSDIVVYDEQAVEDRFGLKPDQIADLKGLKGDSSDNIPGVPGIGDKTAQSLLSKYGTVEGVLDHVSELPEGKVKKALQENADLARLSKHLATIVTEVPFEFDLESYRFKQPDYDALRDLFVRLEFKTMLKRLPEVEQAAGKTSVEGRPGLGECRRINSAQELNALIESLRKAGAFAMQCNTSQEKSIDARLMGISFCADPIGTAYVQIEDAAEQNLTLSMGETYKADLPDLVDILSNEDLTKYVHDAKRNIAALALRGVELRGIDFDAMLGAYVLDSSRSSYDIGSIAFEQLSIELAGVTSKEAEVDEVKQFCSEAEVIYRVKPLIEERLQTDAEYGLYHDIELPLAGILADMELTGVTIDRNELEALSLRLNSQIRELEQQIYEIAGEQFNIGSPKQIGVVLFEKMGLTGGKRTKTGYSTSAATLEALAGDHPIVEQILRWRELTKLKSTYADSLPKLINPATGRVHTSLNQAVTATGRLSSSDPNLQNIPIRTELGREIRKAFVAKPGCVLLSADYSQIELRIMAHVTGDAGLVSAFEHDLDIHTRTASTIFGCSEDEVTPEMRRRAKTVNFAVIYGMSDFALSRTLDIPIEEARTYIDTYFARFPGVREYTNSTIEQARDRGYVSTQLGRRRYVPDIHNANRNVRQFAERAAVNMPIQGMAADIIKIAMIRIADALAPYKAKMVLQVHDELLFEVPTEELDAVAELVRQSMESAHPLKVPLKVDVKAGSNWAEMESIPRRS